MPAKEYPPEFYDLFRNPTADIPWYVTLAKDAGGPVLELGAGTGRVLIQVARAGVEIKGLDHSPSQLDVAKKNIAKEAPETQKRIELQSGEFEDFSLGRTFKLIYIPFNAFLHNNTKAAQRACLECCYNHLESGGVLALDIFHPSLEIMTMHSGMFEGIWRQNGSNRDEAGNLVLQSELTRFDTVAKTLVSLHKYERFNTGGIMTETSVYQVDYAYLEPGDMKALLSEAGFSDIQIFPNFRAGDIQSEKDQLGFRAVKP